ncbi:MAG: ABC transporter permease [Acidobacteria bacterium]|nr:ABC transporter permease [Acidobacteriota bacterium]
MTLPLWLCRLVPYLARRQADADVAEELRLHLELEQERQRDAGAEDPDARRAARRTVGNAILIRERTRDVWGWRWLDDLARDVRHAVRALRRSPGLSATVVIVLALGIGANTAMFSIVHGMLLRPLPYPGGERLVRLGREPRGMAGAPVYLSAREIERVQEAAGSFEEVGAYGAFTFEWSSPDGSLPWGAPVSPALLRLLGATPQLGRLFTDGEARPGADGVVLLSHRAWVRRFGAKPEVVGTVVTVNTERRTVVGVLAEGFHFPTPREEVWTPYVLRPDEPTAIVLGRLREGVSTERAATELRTILQTMELSYTVAQRRGEIAIRMALGARRGDVLALVMRQGAALVATGAIVGLAAAAAGSRILQTFLFGVAADDTLTFVAAPLVLIAAALLACYVPARRATRIAPMEVLRSE